MNELGTAMRQASEDVDVRTGFTGDVLRGGRRRQARRRVGVAVTMAVVIGVVGFGAGMAVRGWPDTPTPQDRRLLEPTKGDLAGDPDRLDTATLVWQRSLTTAWQLDRGVTELRGEPHVYWAATTSVGDAAVVMQEAQVKSQVRTLVGLVGQDPADGSQKLLGSTTPGDPERDKESFQFGPGDRTFLVVDPKIPVYASASSTRNADGVVLRMWQEVPIVDGVGLWTTPGGTSPSTVRLVTSLGPPTITNIPEERELITYPAGSYLRNGYQARRNGTPLDSGDGMWDTKPRPAMHVGSADSGPPSGADVYSILRGAGLIDLGSTVSVGSWAIRGSTPGGVGLVVGEYLEGSGPSTMYAVLFRADGTLYRVLRGPAVDLKSPLPIRLRLPDGQGWVVASDLPGLRYRTSTSGEWQGSFQYAALLPDDAVQVDVAGQVVDLVG